MAPPMRKPRTPRRGEPATAPLHTRNRTPHAGVYENGDAARYRALLDSIDGIVWEADANTFAFTFVSRQTERILGYTPEEWTSNPTFWQDHLHPDDRDTTLQFCATATAENRPHQVVYRFLAADGRTVWLRDVISVIPDASGRPAMLRGVMVDVTEAKEAEEELARAHSLLRAALDSTVDGILVVGSDGKIAEANARFSEIWGIPQEVLTSRDGERSLALTLDQLKDPQAARRRLRDIYARPESESHDVLELKDGRIIERASRPQRLDGHIVGRVWSYQDVTEGVRARESLEEKEGWLSTLIDVMPDFVSFKDGEGRWLIANAFALRLYQIEGVDYRGKTDRDLSEVSPFIRASLDFCEASDEAAWAARGMSRSEEQVPSADGSMKTFDVVKIPLFNPDGSRRALVVVGRDITERKRAEEEARRLNAHLERRVAERTKALAVANQELEAFSYSVSHDLRAPLRGIEFLSQVLLEDYGDRLDSEGREGLQRIRALSQSTTQLVEDLLKLSRATRADVRHEPVDLSALARDVVARMRERQPSREVEIAIPDGLGTVGDSRLLRVVLENILGNAWKYTRHTPHPRIEMGEAPTPQGDGRTFYVRDNGAGFDPSKADMLFRPFQRLHAATEFEGTGIGLATVRRIIERHGGRAWAESPGPGEGATFWFTLPGTP